MQHVFLIDLSEIRQSNSRYFLLTVFAAHLIGIYLYEMKNFCTKEHFRYIYLVCNRLLFTQRQYEGHSKYLYNFENYICIVPY